MTGSIHQAGDSAPLDDRPTRNPVDDEPAVGRVELVKGVAPALSSETQRLLRIRLRGAAALFFMGAGLFVVRELVTRGLYPLFPARSLMSGMLLMLTAVFGGCAALLWSRARLSLPVLRFLELLVFGLPAPVILAVEMALDSSVRSSGRNAILTPVWLALIFTYGMFIPNTWRRAAVVIGLLTSLPLIVYAVQRSQQQGINLLDALATISPSALLLFTGACIAVYGAHMVHALRRQAFEAKQFGQYVLKESLGSGAMGDVHLAEHQLLKRPCAIKVIRPGRARDPNALARFEREVRATARLSHWNVVEIFDYGHTDDGTFYYVMEYLPGKTLAELVELHGPMPPERVIHLLRQVCDALGEAHAQGLVHRDLKPSNLIAAQRGGVYDVIKIVDFGLVAAAGAPGRSDRAKGLILGSPLYMSPEQALGQRPDARSDLYSLGAVGYYLLTGHPPFEGGKPLKVLVGHARDAVVPPSTWTPGIPPDLEEVVLKCLAKAPADRYADAEALGEALAACTHADIWTRQSAARWWQECEMVDVTARAALG